MDFAIIGAVASLIFEQVPALNQFMARLTVGQKRLFMAVLTAIVAIGVNLLAWWNVGTMDRLEWWAFWSLLTDWLIAYVGNQVAHVYVNKPLDK